MKLIPVLIAALFLTGCATQQSVTRDLNIQIAAVEKAKAEAEKARYEAIAQIAATGGDSAKVAAVMALAMNQRPAEATKFVAPEQSPLDTLFHVALGVADRALQVYGIRSNANVAIKQSEYNRDIFTTSYQTIASVAGRIQAPQANITTLTTNTTTNTTTTTNSGNTTRNCQGGNGATGGTASGTTGPQTGGAGAAGGAANC